MKAFYHRYRLHFKNPSGTSRGVMTEKETWFITLDHEGRKGIGECGILRGLSADDRPDYEQMLKWTCENIDLGEEILWHSLVEFPSIQFGVEMAFRSLESADPMILFPSDFTNGKDSIAINGLVWMGSEDFMLSQIREKITSGYRCIKLKIGAIDFEKEIGLLRFIRQHFSDREIEIRVDANGAFAADDAMDRLGKLSEFRLHSIEQPIRKGQHEAMAEICRNSPVPVALDEELIGVVGEEAKETLINNIKPQYIVLKPSFIGGFRGTRQWITLAEKYNIGWWITSALESSIGLNAIAQWTFLQNVGMPQGLGTGALFSNNIDSPLVAENGILCYDITKKWQEIPF